MRSALLLAPIALCACGGSQGSTPADPASQFRRVELETAASPGGVEAADLNGDSRPDLVVTNESGSVSIFLNDGKGRFHTPAGSPYAAGPSPNDVAIGDFNGDEKPDLAFANHETHAISVLLGDGKGAFAAAPAVPVKSVPHPHGIAAADLDRDGHVDLVIDSWGQNRLELLRGNGRGGFAEWEMVPVGQHPYQRPRAADVNRDGWPDLLASNLDSKDLSVLLGGARGFVRAPGSPFPAGDGPFGLAVGDFDGDGHLDVAVVNSPGSAVQSGQDGLTILLGDGSGRFAKTAQSPLETGARPNRLATGDLDGDGHDDVVVSRPDDGSIVIFYLGRKGALVRREEVRLGSGAKGVAIADLDGNGRKDIAVTLQGASRLVLLIR
jgi:hypothetical protein